MPLKVSVIVPVFNPGRHFDRCIGSILHQSLPTDEFEAIFVDDGSTDGTAARLDALAAQHPNIRVIHQANSGWPGKPRNVGITASRAEYVFFLDDDDALGREALARMYAMAARNGADVVLGKMAGHGRRIPQHVFLRDIDHANLAKDPLIDALTPHKLFRRAFIEQHELRFPEGRRRLEDLVFVVKAYLLAEAISVLADYVCYYHFRRDDLSNAAYSRIDPAGYFANLREVIGIVESHTESGSLRDALLEGLARGTLLARLRGRWYLQQTGDFQQRLLAEARAITEDRIGPGVDQLLAPAHRIRMAAVRAGRLDLLLELAEAELRVAAGARLVRLTRTRPATLRLVIEAGLIDEMGPLAVDRRGDRLLLPVPREVAAGVPDQARLIAQPVRGVAWVAVRRRDDSAELVAPAVVELRVETASDGSERVTFALEAEIDPGTMAGGEPLAPGKWNVMARVELFGYAAETRLPRPAEAGDATRAAVLEAGSMRVVAYWSGPGPHLTLDVRAPGDDRLDRALLRRIRRVVRRAHGQVRRSTKTSRGG